MTFDEFFSEHRLTTKEREALVWHLAAYRMRRTIEMLREAPLPFNPRDVLRADDEARS